MKTALIAMTILGCDDAVNECKYVATATEHWVSVELCDAASERILEGYSNAGYPTVVAVCQKPAEQPATETVSTPVAPAVPPVQANAEPAEEEHKGLAARAVDRIREALPGTKGIRMVFETPLHVVSDSYAWVAKKISN